MIFKTIEDIVQENKLTTMDIMESPDVQRLTKSGIVIMGSTKDNKLLNAIDYENVESVFTVGVRRFEYQEPNNGDSSTTEVEGVRAVYGSISGKSYYQNQWWVVANIEMDLANCFQPYRHVQKVVGKYWAITFNKCIAAILTGLCKEAKITVGDGTTNLSGGMIIDARAKKEDKGFGKLSKMYMHSKTLIDILTKQNTGAIKEKLISVKPAQRGIIVTNGTVTQNLPSSEKDECVYIYDNGTDIVLDNDLKPGTISLIDEGAFTLMYKDMSGSLTFEERKREGKGAGVSRWGSKMLYVLHPNSFTFVGKQGTHFVDHSGLTHAELKRGGLYELVDTPKLSPILNLKVKMG